MKDNEKWKQRCYWMDLFKEKKRKEEKQNPHKNYIYLKQKPQIEKDERRWIDNGRLAQDSI